MIRSHRGSIFVELAAAIAGLAALAGIATMAVQDRRLAQALERRAAALETAQNLLARIRRGETAAESGWTIERDAVAPGLVRVRVRGEGVVLATILAESAR